MKVSLSIALVGAVLATAPAAAAPLVQYDFTGAPGNQASTAASNVAAKLTGLGFTRGTGLTAAGAANSISASGWSTAADDYYDFGFTIGGGVTATVNQLIFGSQSSASGPGFINILAAIDGGAFNQVATYSLQPTTNLSQMLTFGTALTATNRLEFRFVAANNTAANGSPIATAGTFRVTNYLPGGVNTAFTIGGTVNQVAVAVPEPATWATMIGGFGLVGVVLRRRRVTIRVATAR